MRRENQKRGRRDEKEGVGGLRGSGPGPPKGVLREGPEWLRRSTGDASATATGPRPVDRPGDVCDEGPQSKVSLGPLDVRLFATATGTRGASESADGSRSATAGRPRVLWPRAPRKKEGSGHRRVAREEGDEWLGEGRGGAPWGKGPRGPRASSVWGSRYPQRGEPPPPARPHSDPRPDHTVKFEEGASGAGSVLGCRETAHPDFLPGET